MDISGEWGYGAIVIPKDLAWQGFRILDPDDPMLADAVGAYIARAEEAVRTFPDHPVAVEGILSAGAVDHLQNGREPSLGITASALSKVIGHRFWVIDVGMESDEKGTYTTVVRLDVTSPEAARDAINSRVMPLKMGQLLRQMKAAK